MERMDYRDCVRLFTRLAKLGNRIAFNEFAKERKRPQPNLLPREFIKDVFITIYCKRIFSMLFLTDDILKMLR